jgi:choline dehydrogenase-like flavoprotein
MTLPIGLSTHDSIDHDLKLSGDVVVVGSGAGGATVAAELAEAGIDVIVLEEGGYHPTESFQTRMGHALRTLYRDGGGGSALGSPPILFSEGRCVGGSTVVNGGMAFRTPDRVLDAWRRDIAGLALDFATVERRLHVGGQDPETIGRDSQRLKTGADVLGWHIIPNTRNQIHCAGSNNCTLGCPTGAKQSMLLTSVPRALARGARLFADCRVERVTRSGGRITGVTGRIQRPDGKRGPRITVTAPVVVVAGGAVQTPALLMRSGFRSPHLGRHLTMHPNAKLVALFDDDILGWQGVHQAYQVREFFDEGILITAVNLPPGLLAMAQPEHGRALGDLMDSYDRMVIAGCLVEDTGSGRVRNVSGLGPQVFYQITDEDAARVVRGVALTARVMFAAGARRILATWRGAPELHRMEDVDALLERPVPKTALDLFTVHLMGTARMHDDPRLGVVSAFGAFHGVPGLFVADASIFPGPVGLNPMETIVALATRNAQWLVEQRTRYGV